MGKKLIEFPPNYIQPAPDKKRAIQTGYLDVLYLEYREDHAYWYGQIGIVCVFLAVVIWMARDYLGIVLAITATVGAFVWYHNSKESNRFRSYKKTIQEELRELGVGILHEQLNDNTRGSTAWGKLAGYATSSLGIVRPVSTKGMIEPLQYLFDVFDDEVYRER